MSSIASAVPNANNNPVNTADDDVPDLDMHLMPEGIPLSSGGDGHVWTLSTCYRWIGWNSSNALVAALQRIEDLRGFDRAQTLAQREVDSLAAEFNLVAPERPRRRSIHPNTRLLVYERDEYTCVDCGARKNLTLDHIIPVIRGGTDDIDNLETRCRSCNSRKGPRVA